MKQRAFEARRRELERGLLACYEVIDKARKELAELDAKERAEPVGRPVKAKTE